MTQLSDVTGFSGLRSDVTGLSGLRLNTGRLSLPFTSAGGMELRGGRSLTLDGVVEDMEVG